MGEDEPTAETHSYWPHWSLVEPRQGALLGGRQRKLASKIVVGTSDSVLSLGLSVQVNRGIDVDVIVAEVRETSHKPDEVWRPSHSASQAPPPCDGALN